MWKFHYRAEKQIISSSSWLFIQIHFKNFHPHSTLFPINYSSSLFLSLLRPYLITLCIQIFIFATRMCVEVESAYERALEEEEERILCTRKKLLLNTRKVREREHEMVIQERQSALRKQLESNENELNEMLRRLNKQVKWQSIELRMKVKSLGNERREDEKLEMSEKLSIYFFPHYHRLR